nr:MAG TPA: hypothetical protein [Caudoviricetes sp.]
MRPVRFRAVAFVLEIIIKRCIICLISAIADNNIYLYFENAKNKTKWRYTKWKI